MDSMRFARLSIDIRKHLRAEDIRQLKMLMAEDFEDGELQSMNDFLDIWDKLKRTKRIKPDDLRYLRDKFYYLCLAELVKQIDEAVEGTPESTGTRLDSKASTEEVQAVLQRVEVRDLAESKVPPSNYVTKTNVDEMREWLENRLKERSSADYLLRRKLVGMNFAMAVIDSDGGEISFSDCVKMTIPKDALTDPVVIHCFMPVALEDTNVDDAEKKLIYFSPTINCGPDGTKFKKKITLQFKHCIAESDLGNTRTLDIFTRRQGINWSHDDSSIFQIWGKWVTVKTDHFTDFALATEEPSPLLPRREIAVSTVIVSENQQEEPISLEVVMTGNDAVQRQGFLSSLQKVISQRQRVHKWLVGHRSHVLASSFLDSENVYVKTKKKEYATILHGRNERIIPRCIIGALPLQAHVEDYKMERNNETRTISKICDVKFYERFDHQGSIMTGCSLSLPVLRHQHIETPPMLPTSQGPLRPLDSIEAVAERYGVQVSPC